jgi:hypothetical protein
VGDLGSEHRATLTQVLATYIQEVEFEREAGRISEASAQIEKLKAAAAEFVYLLDSPISDDLSRDALHFVEGLLNDHFEARFSDAPARVSQLSGAVREFLQACNYAEQQICRMISQPMPRRLRLGRAWHQHFIPPLAEFWEQDLSFPGISIRKDGDKFTVDKEVPFVAFAKHLERALPERFHGPFQGEPSSDTYRAAVSRALSAYRRSRERNT